MNNIDFMAERQGNVRPMRARRDEFSSRTTMEIVRGTREKAEIPTRVSRQADTEAKNQKVLEMLPLLHRVAKKMRTRLPANVEMDDLIGAGVLGLIDAVEKFDSSRNVRFETYAQFRIRGAIIDSLRATDDAPRDLRKKNKKAEAALRELEGKLGRPATDEEFAEAQGMTLSDWYRQVMEMQALGLEWFRPMDTIRHDFVDETPYPPTHENQFDLCYLREKREIFNRALADLPAREQHILVLYYTHELTMDEIGDRLDIDGSRVSQLHSAALNRLRTIITTMLRAPDHSNILADDEQQLRAA